MTPPDTRTLVTKIAQQLGETQPGPLQQLRRIVQRLGPEAALAVLQETQAIEAQGGLLLPDGSRRHTPGGVFFRLVRERVSPEERAILFPPRQHRQRHQQRPHAQPSSPPTPAQLAALPNVTGEIRTVKLTLLGRPGPVVPSQAGYLMTTLPTPSIPALPPGLPAPPPSLTTYTVYLTPKQWRPVAEALHDPEDTCIIEGFPAFDPTLEGVAVYALNVTTKQLQQAARAARQPRS
jgi:hypothetical protein